MRLGFIGTGTIAAAMVEGLGGGHILLSPRGAGVAAALTARYPAVRVAVDNQAVVDGSDMVVLSIRPQIAEDVIRALRFRPGQQVVSLVAATPVATLQGWIGLDLPVTRAIPLPFVATGQGVTPVFPPDPAVIALFNRLGTAVACQTEAEFDLFATGSALMGSYFGILEAAQDWLVGQGLPPESARTYLAGLFASLGEVARTCPDDFAALRLAHSTKGGLNEQMFRVFVQQDGTTALTAALDQVLARVCGREAQGKA